MRQGNYNNTYDTMYRLDTMSFTFDGQTALFDYAYDLVGRQTQSALTLNNVADRTVNIEYDYLGRSISAELTGNALNDILAEFDYNANGLVTDVNRYEWDANDDLYELIAKSNIQYNARNQITNITHADASNVAIATHSYSFSPDGNITQYINSIDGTVTYTNDFLGQLIGADYSNLDITDESYQYDLNGNRELVTNSRGDLVVYATGTNNELNSDGNYSYIYDAEGNRISKTNAAGTERELYSWDYRNRLESVTKQTYDSVSETWETVQIVEYAYDYNNVLIRKVLDANGDGTADSKTLFLPENYQTAIQLDDADLSDSTDATVSHRYLWTPGQQDKLLADIQVSPTGSETLWTLTDHLGTIRDIIQQTPTGLIQKTHVIYDAYGNVLSCKDANGTDVSNPVLFGFTGKYFDSDTQLQNNVNRWYDSIIGRWLSTDPIGFNGNDTNLYRYVGNQILCNVDSKGLWGPTVPIVIIGGGALLIIALPDWHTDWLTNTQREAVNDLVNEMIGCLSKYSQYQTEVAYLRKLYISAIFEDGYPKDDPGSAETRDGRFFFYGNRTILPSDFFERTSKEEKFRTLIHESYHAGTEVWTEDYSYDYTDRVLRILKQRCPCIFE